MRYNIYCDTPGHFPRHDRDLVEAAHKQRWEDIEPEKAETEEARCVLHQIAVRKYHIDEARAGMI